MFVDLLLLVHHRGTPPPPHDYIWRERSRDRSWQAGATIQVASARSDAYREGSPSVAIVRDGRLVRAPDVR